MHTLQCQPVFAGRKKRCLLAFHADDSDDDVTKKEQKGKGKNKGESNHAREEKANWMTWCYFALGRET